MVTYRMPGVDLDAMVDTVFSLVFSVSEYDAIDAIRKTREVSPKFFRM